MRRFSWVMLVAACGGGSGGGGDDQTGLNFQDAAGAGDSPIIGDCAVFPANNIFNTQIGALPKDPASDQYVATIGAKKLHLDLGQNITPTSDEYYGIPYNAVHGNSMEWLTAKYAAVDTGDYYWHPATESECGDASHAVQAPCTGNPILPIPDQPLVEGGVNTTAGQQPDGDHHMLIVDSDSCRLWETYHSYKTNNTWNIFGSAEWDLHTNDLRTADWSSADAAGLPILPLLLKASEASSGTIKHALRFTIASSKIAPSYVWPGRHQTETSENAAHPPMAQLFRLKESFQIPASYSVQSKAILQAMKTYGMYLADGGSDWYISGEPSADWDDSVFDEVQSVTGDNFEAVDIKAITSRSGFDPNSGAVP
ncbi:MAG TPA: hypothetical protein VGC41_15985 [Kofleriaceae bacterium]